MAGDEDLITIISPDDMVLGYDPATGMPRAEPTNRATGGTVSTSGQPVVDPNEFENIKSRLTAAEQERDNLARLAQEEKAKAEKAEKDASTNTDYALRAHWKNINLEHENAVAAFQKASSDHEQLTSWISATQAFQRQAENDLARAVEAGDAAGQADANKRISTSAAQLVNLEEGKRGAASAIEDRKRDVAQKKYAIDDTARRLSALDRKEPAETTKSVTPPAAPQTADDFIKAAPENTREWLSAHREFATPGTRDNQRVQTFAAMWLADKGVDGKNQRTVNDMLNSDEFRIALDHKFFPKEPAMADEVKVTPTPQPQVQTGVARQQAPAAPVSRSGTPGSPTTQGRITLTQDQFNHAPLVANEQLWETFDPDLKQRFGQWSETAARFQYDRWHKKAQVERPHRLT